MEKNLKRETFICMSIYEDKCICITESLCCTPETNTELKLTVPIRNDLKIKIKLKKEVKLFYLLGKVNCSRNTTTKDLL